MTIVLIFNDNLLSLLIVLLLKIISQFLFTKKNFGEQKNLTLSSVLKIKISEICSM